MRTIRISLAVFAVVCLALPARAQTKRWTNADMDTLRARGGISIVGPETPLTSVATAPAEAPAPGPVYASHLEDPTWYADQAADLQIELGARMLALTQAQTNLSDAQSGRGTTGGVNMAAGDTYGVTPEEAIAGLQAQIRETQAHLDELADLARRNDIAPGVVRIG